MIVNIRKVLLSAIDRILAFNGISLNLYFKTLKPLEFTDLENAQTEEQVAEETGTQLSKHDDLISNALIDKGELPNENWLLIDEYGYVIKNPSLVSTRPIDMPNKGFLPKGNK